MSFGWNLSSDEEELGEWTRKPGYSSSTKVDDDDDDQEEKKQSTPPVTPSPFASAKHAASVEFAESSSDDDEDGVDWEDADDDDDDDDGDRKPPAITTSPQLRAITIDLNKTEDETTAAASKENKKTKKRKRRNTYRVESLPPAMQSLLKNLHRSHLLALTSRAVYVSSACSNIDVLAVAHSLIPAQWSLREETATTPTTNTTTASASDGPDDEVPPATPTATTRYPDEAELRSFLEWYFDLVHGVTERRASQRRANVAAGAPNRQRHRISRSYRGGKGRSGSQVNSKNNSMSHASSPTTTTATSTDLLKFMSYLSVTNDEDPQLAEEAGNLSFAASFDQQQLYVELLIAMARSMGWRARFVQAMDPVTHDLNVDHPLLASMCGNIFAAVWKNKSDLKPPSAKKIKRKVSPATTTTSAAKESEALTLTNEAGSAAAENKILGWVEILCTDPSSKSKHRWLHVDPVHKLVNRPDQVEVLLERSLQGGTPRKQTTKRGVVAYTVGVEHCLLHRTTSCEGVTRLRLTDVTPRYAESWVASLRTRGIVRSKKCSIDEKVRKSWWSKTLLQINDAHRPASSDKFPEMSPTTWLKSGASKDEAILLDEDDEEEDENDKKLAAVDTEEQLDPFDSLAQHEKEELAKSASSEAIPTSKAAFKTHPTYVIPSELGKAEVLAPDASKRICGVFKGQLVYRRADVSTTLTAKKWLYEGRKVRDEELSKPVKRRNVRKKPAPKGFKALRSYGVGASNDGDYERQVQLGSKPLEDGMEDLYAKWQTLAWSPAPVGPDDAIPVNEFKNIELAFLNPGLVHIDHRGLAAVAKKLGIPYAPCLLGFEGHGGNRTPTVRGIVVHKHNEQLLREAGVEVSSHAMEQEHKDRRNAILLRWKRLMVGLLTKARLDREYGSDIEFK